MLTPLEAITEFFWILEIQRIKEPEVFCVGDEIFGSVWKFDVWLMWRKGQALGYKYEK